MALFDKKTLLGKLEEQFKVKEMQNKRLFYDLFARVGDPEELRGTIMELMQDLGWKTSVSELTKWEEPDTEGIFRGGRLKPVRYILKSHNTVDKGPRFPLIWKLFAVIGVIFLAFYFYTLVDQAGGWNSDLIIKITPIWFVLAILVYLIKERVSMALWTKVSGIYDINSEEADVRIVIGADAEKPDKQAFDKLESDVVEFYNVLTRKYVRKAGRDRAKKAVAKEMKVGKRAPAINIVKGIRELTKEIGALEKKFIAGKVKEGTYKELKEDLTKRKERLETVLDLIETS